MKIMYWAPYVGHVGTIKAVINSATSFRNNGHLCYLFKNHSEWIGYENYLNSNGIEIIDLGGDRLVKNKKFLHYPNWRPYMVLAAFQAFFILPKIIIKLKPDVVIVNLVSVPVILAFRIIGLLNKTTLIISIQGFPKFLNDNNKIKKSLFFKFEDFIRKILWSKLYNLADYILCMTDTTLKKIEKLNIIGEKKLKLVNNPIIDKEILQFNNKYYGKEFNDEIFEKFKHPVLIAVGRLSYQKDYFTMLEAFSKVKKIHNTVSLIILGEGELREQLILKINELNLNTSVFLKGQVSNPYWYVKRSNLYLQTSLWEDPGHALIEAAALRIPIVATNCESGPAEILSHGKAGYLCEIGNSECIADAIINCLNDKDVVDKINLAEINSYKYSLNSHYTSLIEIINNG